MQTLKVKVGYHPNEREGISHEENGLVTQHIAKTSMPYRL
jgi:hypothetical protein